MSGFPPNGYGQAIYPQYYPQYQPQPQLPPVQYAQQQLPQIPYKMEGNASLNAIFGNNYFAQGYGTFEFSPSSLTMGPAFSNSPLFNQPSGGVLGGQGGMQGGMMGGGSMSPMYAGGGNNFGGADIFGQGMMPSFADFANMGMQQGGANALYANDNSSPYEQNPRGVAQSFNHYGFDQFGRMIGNFYDIASNGVDQMAYRGRVVGPIDPKSLSGSAYIANPIIMGQVFGVGPASFGQVTDKGAYAYGGAEAYNWNNKSPGQVLLDYDGPAIYNTSNPKLNQYGQR